MPKKKHEEIYVKPEEKVIRVSVKLPVGRFVGIDIVDSSKIDECKVALEDVSGVAREDMKLLFAGKELRGHRRLDEIVKEAMPASGASNPKHLGLTLAPTTMPVWRAQRTPKCQTHFHP
eukprot:TRINITY_DN21990_c0_g1_i1.p1 TRINITY_DN21990_c0_g1~~TRINITY_DN21990_c0_g1_i1.p1  ORF type:complete len:119 (-),score=27.01 TRINITY_DN21990_c0_g1_i1:104-460(-)